MPLVKESAAALKGEREVLGLSESRFWFVRPVLGPEQVGRPVVALDAVKGVLWSGTSRIDLMSEYARFGRKIDAIVSSYFPAAY